jgi:hypothetical protein
VRPRSSSAARIAEFSDRKGDRGQIETFGLDRATALIRPETAASGSESEAFNAINCWNQRCLRNRPWVWPKSLYSRRLATGEARPSAKRLAACPNLKNDSNLWRCPSPPATQPILYDPPQCDPPPTAPGDSTETPSRQGWTPSPTGSGTGTLVTNTVDGVPAPVWHANGTNGRATRDWIPSAALAAGITLLSGVARRRGRPCR